MPRFYLKEALSPGLTLPLPDITVRHIQALRLRDGTEITLFNGQGGEWQAQLSIAGRRDFSAVIGEYRAIERESPLQLELVQGVSMGDRMDFTLQKAVELGVVRIQPVLTERSARIPADRLESRQQHWQRLVESACEQCGRNTIPVVAPLQTWKSWLPQAPATGLVLSPLGEVSMKNLPKPTAALPLLAGPEGGLTPEEEKNVIARGWQPIRMGPRILRTETAALTAMAALQTLWGDFADV